MRSYRRAASEGSAEGVAFLSGMYRDGRGVEKDPKEAIRWLRRAAAAGHPTAAAELKKMEKE